MADFVDLLLNEACWPHLFVPEELTDHFVAGIDEHNAHARLKVVCFKLRTEDPDDQSAGAAAMGSSRQCSPNSSNRCTEERSPVLVSCLVSILRRAWVLVPMCDLLETLQVLPEGLRERSRAWVLCEAPDVDPELLVSEVESAVGARLITGDDVCFSGSGSAVGACGWLRGPLETGTGGTAFGRADRAGHGVRLGPARMAVPRSSWTRFLPDDASSAWRNATQLIEARFGALDRDWVSKRRRAEAFVVTSPFTEDELEAQSPEQAAVQIAAWRAGPQDWDHDPRQLAGTLQRVVQQAPHDWLSDPVGLRPPRSTTRPTSARTS